MTVLAAPAAAFAALARYDLRGLGLTDASTAASTGASGVLPPERVRPLGNGLINLTYLVDGDGGARAVLQRVNPIFGLAVHEDIEAVTAHLSARGLPTPRLYRTADGALAADLGDAGVWRLMTYLPSVTFLQMAPHVASAAGALVGRFHASLFDLVHTFRFVRAGAHDLRRHEATLRTALERARAQPGAIADLPAAFVPLAEEILASLSAIPSEVAGPLRVCHGDLKVSNLLFAPGSDTGAPAGLALVDLDTLGRLPLSLELGDALRSWCSTRSEDDPACEFSLELLERALAGYAEHGRRFLTEEEAQAIVPGVLRVTTQLAARFAADVVNQSYFGWDPGRFPSRAAHNQRRAEGQLALARSLRAQLSAAEHLAQRLLRP